MKKFVWMLMAVAFVTNAKAQSSDPKVMNNFIDGLMKQMTLQEKLGQLNLITPGSGIPTGSVVSTDVEKKLREGKVGGMFGVIGYDKIKKAQDIVMNESRLKIPLFFGSDVIHGYKTTFPIPLALSCSWDTALIRRSAMIAADEASADGLNWTFSPMVDVARDPRWGRVAEGSGEDPFLGSQIAAAMVKGYQGASLAANNTLMACVKHFALYGASEAGRDYNSVDMSRNKMYNEYLPPYKAAIDAGVASVMSSFNDIDGVPATGNRWLLTDLLRKQWKFNGFVVSDYTSLSEMINHGLGNLQEVSALALNAGLDMDMVSEGLLNTLALSVAEKKVSVSQIDAACRNILVAKYKLGLFDHPYKTMDEDRAKSTILSNENRAFARTVATQSFVLLKNEQQALPLSNKGTLALIGPLANDKSNMLGTWAVSGDPQLSVPVLTGMKQVGGSGINIVYAKGANITDDPALAARANVFGMRAEIDARSPEAMLEEALQIAKTADKIVAVVGEASEMSGEAASRADISLPASQQKLLKALYATGKPVIVVNMSGRPMVLTGLTEGAAAIIQVWHAGIEAGNAVADVLFGKVNPSGKLTMSFPYAVGQIPVYYSQKNTGRPLSPENKFSTKYLDIPNEALFPFGFGLNYSKIEYGKPVISNTTLTSKKPITVTVKVTNAGKYDAQEVVQCYTQDKVRSITPPGKELKAFQKIALKAGETKQVVFTITESMLAFWNADLKFAAEPGEFNVMIGGNSRDVQSLSFMLK